MNKDVQKAIDILNEKEAASREAIDKAAAEVRATEATLIELRAALDNAGGRDEYIKIAAQIRDNEAALSFCQKREQEARAKTLLPEELEQIQTTAKGAFDKAKAEHKKAIKAEIDKLEKLFAAYDTDAETVTNLLTKAARLANKDISTNIAGEPLFDAIKESNSFYPHVMAAYQRYKAANIMMQHAAIKAGGAK